MSTRYKIVIADLPDREQLVSEIWYDDHHVAEINQESSELAVEFYPTSQPLEITELLDVLQFAAQDLRLDENSHTHQAESSESYSIEITSLPDRNKLVAEVWSGTSKLAEINEEGLQMTVKFYPTNLTLNLMNFLDALQHGQHRLINMGPSQTPVVD